MYLDYRTKAAQAQVKSLSKKDVNQLKESVGGEEVYQQILGWANSNLTQDEQAMFDHVIDTGDPISSYFAVQNLFAKYNDSVGSDGALITGKPASTSGDTFKSQAALVSAMSDPRYDRDPAYRQEIQQKLERSNVSF